MMIYGGPHASSFDAGHVRWHPQLMAAPGYVVLATDYTGSVGYGEAFARAIEIRGQATTIEFELQISAVTLDEVVVTGTAGAVEKRKVGSSMATV